MGLRLAKLGVVGILTLAATGCIKPAAPQQPPVEVDSSQVETLVYWSPKLDGRRIVIDGYIGFDNGPNGDAIALGPELTTEPFGKGDELIRFDLGRGGGPNQLQLPVLERRSFPQAPGAAGVLTVDLAHATFQDSAGVARPLQDKVRVTGRLVYLRLGDAGLMTDEDSRSPTGRRFKPRLVDVALDAAPAE